MLWVEVDLQTWFRRCMPETKPLPIGTRFDAPEVVLDGRERDLYSGLNVALNRYLETIGCTAFRTHCTATRKAEVTSHATNASDRPAVHCSSCPDLVIFPTHEEAAKTYKLTNDEIVEHHDAAHDEASNGLVPGSEESPPPPAPVPVMPEGGTAPPSPSPVSDDPLPKDTHAKMSWHWAEVLVEVEHSAESFPFSPNDFLPQEKKPRISRDQITHHAAQIAATQHRQSVLLVLILKGDARLLRFDRNGAAVSEPFDYVSQPEIIGELFHRAFCSPEPMAKACRGHDPTAKLAAIEDAKFFRALHERYGQSSTVAKALKRAASEGWPIYQLDVYGMWSEDGVAPLNHASPRHMSTHRCLVGRPEYASSSMVGRGTKCFVVWDLELRQPLLIKDTWRPDSVDIRTEAENYMTLWDIPLHDMFIPTLLATGDVLSLPNATTLHYETTDTARCSESMTTGPHPSVMDLRQRTVTQDLVKDSRLASRIHHRLGLAEICSPLQDFAGPYELLVAVYTAIQAHQYAFERCRLLHEDISVGNILLYERPNAPPGASRIGLLSDWDLAKTREQIEKSKGTQQFISGTWQFMSAVLQYMHDKPHELSDDLESFLHVLNWCALKYLPHSLSADKDGLASYFARIYDTVELRRIGTNAMAPTKTCTYERFSRVRHGYSFVDGLPPSHPFTKVLNGLTKLCQRHYASLPIDPPSTLPNLVHRPVVEVPAKELPGARNRQTVVPPPGPPAQAVHDEPEAADTESPLTSHTAFLAVFEDLLDPTKWEGQESALGKTEDQIPYYPPQSSMLTSDTRSMGSQSSSYLKRRRGQPGPSTASPVQLQGRDTRTPEVADRTAKKAKYST